MEQWIIQMMEKFGYLGVALLIALENVFPPIPSEVILTFGGFMTTYTSLNVWLLILMATVGSVLGGLVLYGVGRILDADRLERILSGKIGKILHLKPQDVEKAQRWFSRKGKATVFFCRFIPIVRSLISIPAGMMKMNAGIFLVLTTLGTAIWNTVLVWLGVFAGASWEKIVGYLGVYSEIALVVLVICVLIVGIIFYRRRLKKKKGQAQVQESSLEDDKGTQQ